MKSSRSIGALIALAVLLAVYDGLKEMSNFSTVVALIVILSLVSAWLIIQLVINKFFSEEEDAEGQPKTNRFAPISEWIRLNSRIPSPGPRRIAPPRLGSFLRVEGTAQVERPVERDRTAAAKAEVANARAKVQRIVQTLCTVPGITSAAIVSTGGIVLVSAPMGAIEHSRASAVTVSMFELGTRIVTEFGRNQLEEIMVRGDCGEVFFQRIVKEAFIMVLVQKDTPIGRVVRETKHAADLAAVLMAT
jgi:predicted regulator of Ras-like GTPase activity (Roadblock/LC7/MglB family)